MAEAQDICGKCGRAKRSAVAGSLTQWLFSANACECDFLKLAAEIDHHDFEKERLCAVCGKRTNEGRKGSLTQWVFRADTCSCGREELSAANFSPARLPLVISYKRLPAFVPDEALTAQLGFSNDRYVAIELLGRGTGAQVYKCWDKTLNKFVAIKRLTTTGLNDQEIIRFQEEARSTSSLSHSSIVRVLDFGQNRNGQPFMVMEFIDGKSLDVLIEDNGPMPSGVLALIFISICAGMHHAHQSGVFHRDLKSANIMIPLGGAAVPLGKVIDFGVAAMHKSGEEGLFQGHAIAGTPGYMSPDQLRGETFDRRSDIYSLGCTMFEALTGRVPFKGATTIDVFSQHANATPPYLVDVRPDIEFSEMLENIVAKTLSKQKSDRYQSMLELKAALEEFLEDHGSTPSESHGDTRIGIVTPKKSLPWMYIAVALIAISIAVVGWKQLLEPESKGNTTHSKKKKNERVSKAPALIDEFADNVFHLESTEMSDEKLKELPRETEELDLVASDVTDEGIRYLVGLPLKELRLDATKITDEGLKDVAKVKSLRKLNVGENPLITGVGLKYLEALPHLDFLSLNATAMRDDDLKSLSQMTQLTQLSVGSMKNLTGTGFVHLIPLKQLRVLRLSGMNLSPKGAECLGGLTGLESIEFRAGQISDEFIDSVAGMKKMSTLNLSESSITDKQLAGLGTLKNLKLLRLEKCPNLTADGIARISKQLPECRISDIQTGTL